MKKIFTVFILFSIIVLVTSHKTTREGDKSYVDGEIMVKFNPELIAKQESAVNYLLTDFTFIRLEYQAKLSNRLGIHLFRFTPEILPDEDILREFRRHPMIELAQFNHFIERRETIPSDQYFFQQWNMMNIGQNGGVIDADIDATDAWDIATGLVTATGDSIVIAVVDDGFDLDHEDLIFWVNDEEIPSNGIDDDTNGYVDDYYGWNAYFSNGNITQADHGTHVTGIASALSDNDQGVAGVNWDTPVMAVQGSSTLESIVVEAYSYVYEMRKRYNETNGAHGAFVVSTNSSFGVNQGQPEVFPIWGAMYDSMGAEGILSAAATANANWNIDEEGDIPTAFDNEHLISVTNTKNDDEKAYSAGYGLVTIDLGAPGTSVYSTRQNNNYGTKSGTSMASPHVAGAVALLYSAATEEFMEAYHNDPSGMALVIKQHILNGTDPLPTLEGKCVSGGRLNLYKSIQQMLNPLIAVSPQRVYYQIMPETNDSMEVTLINNSDSTFDYVLTYDPTVTWLDLNKDTGTLDASGADSFVIYLNSEGLDTALYFTYVKINYADTMKFMLPVNMDILPNVGIKEDLQAHVNLLLSAYPNPFYNQLRIPFSLNESSAISLTVHDLNGRKVKELVNGFCPEGDHVVTWNGNNEAGSSAPTGIYFIHLASEDTRITRKVMKVR
jgi:subtilisin family serine protease